MACRDFSDSDSDGFDEAEELMDSFLPPCASLFTEDKYFKTAEECLKYEKEEHGFDVEVGSLFCARRSTSSREKLLRTFKLSRIS